tara:strand:+ start:396 stop:1388 length:993 start_codon:yes stop_codon:yes gene_type:complete
MSNNKLYSLLTYLAFITSLTSFSRLLQTLWTVNTQAEIKVSRFFENSNLKEECRIEKRSILEIASGKKRKMMLVIIDAYPSENLFKALVGSSSYLHQLIQSEAKLSINAISEYPTTPYSLAKILGQVKYKRGCTYPLFGRTYNPNFINSSQYFSKKGTLCTSKINSFSEAIALTPLKIGSYLPFISKPSKSRYEKYLNKKVKNCSLANPAITSSLVDWVQNLEGKDKVYPLIFHDVYFHQYTKRIDFYKRMDTDYTNTFRELLAMLKIKNVVDDLIILSDHGPRTGIFSKPNSTNNELAEYDNKGYFIYYLPLKDGYSKYKKILESVYLN